MGDCQVIESSDRHTLYKADRHGLRFKIKTTGFGPYILLTASHKPSLQLYKIILGQETRVMNLCEGTEMKFPSKCISHFLDHKHLWVTWYNNKIKVGMIGEQIPFVEYDRLYTEPSVGFVQFKTSCRHGAPIEWIIESSPVILKTVACRRFNDKLCWQPLDNGKLPHDAMVGGFENELTYIARSHHNNSLCPGKYVPSMGVAFVPWGHREHSKEEFEILCGFNAKWVKTKCNHIPTNAFIGGYSEVQNEPLYIGRAMYDGKLLIGKVHVRYDLCYLPYHGREVEISTYEILVIPEDAIRQSLPTHPMLCLH
ncbi:uncharacterized protein LOC113496989 [Trichoplusia ni]|uniref:Uncharacterized protein LOC113496989 n=1 Tax=Trichoplusia ni TaxID=7111 RepID=A0A7E5VV68_TRINI|nr:uncharacterized protein LOC113496989 [Trichoplusia ni]